MNVLPHLPFSFSNSNQNLDTLYIDPSYHPAVSKVDYTGIMGGQDFVHPYITKYDSTLYIEMDEVLAPHYACTFENFNLHFHFQL